jgi:hypothetical protein
MSDEKDRKPSSPRFRRLTVDERAGMAAADKARDAERYGPASKGRRVTAWHCNYGWTGTTKDLKPAESGIACPSCGQTGGLAAGISST